MKTNVHKFERFLRIILGAVLVSMIFWGPKNYWFALGAIPLLTGLAGSCPLYTILGISTCGCKEEKETSA